MTRFWEGAPHHTEHDLCLEERELRLSLAAGSRHRFCLLLIGDRAD